jgi:tRNA(Ile)-lysidine synthase
MSRREILEYCTANSLEFVTDSTNTDTDYTRNKIRAEIIPALTKINSGAVENASRLADSLRVDALCLADIAERFLAEENDGGSINIKKLLDLNESIGNRVIMTLYNSVSNKDALEHSHIRAIRELCRYAVPHSTVQLPCDIDARIENGTLCFLKRADKPTPPDEFCVKLNVGKNTISQINAEIVIGNSQTTKNIYKKSTLLYLASAKICGEVVARERRAGDKIKVNGVNKSIKKLLCDLKIPLDIRYRLPVICDDEGVIAVPFAAVSDKVKPQDSDDSITLHFGLI